MTLSASADIKVTAGVNGEGKGMGAAVSGSLGDKTSYDVKTDPANADKIDHGELPPPNPADPYSIPKGSSITLNRDSYKGTRSVTYHNITAELGYKDGHRVSSAVERVGDDKVRITVGDTDFVDNLLSLKYGDDHAAVGVSVGNGFQDGKARAIDLDLSTPEGRSAYERFIGSGRLPADPARPAPRTRRPRSRSPHPHRPDHGQGRPARRDGRRDRRPGPGRRDYARRRHQGDDDVLAPRRHGARARVHH